MSVEISGWLHIALAVVRDSEGRVLLARRSEDKHQGGLWEFPGGKVEVGESVLEALCRELQEEVGLVPTASQPLMQIRHRYKDRAVLLDCWEVTRFEGEAAGLEGQPVRWEKPQVLDEYPFPAANRALIKAVQLPKRYWITPDAEPEVIRTALTSRLETGVRLMRLRVPSLSQAQQLALSEECAQALHALGGVLLVGLELWQSGAWRWADGIQLNRHELSACAARKLAELRTQDCRWLAASCHDAEELNQAEVLGCDFATLSPFKPTQSHPGAEPLGTSRARTLLEQAGLPVYLLGGLGDTHLSEAQSLGAQGIAGIRQVGIELEPFQ